MYELTWKNHTLWGQHTGEETIPPPPPDANVTAAALLVWEEHCVECSIPECYTSCSLHVRRRDQKCARFTYGIYPNPGVAGLLPYGADITFRRWAKLEAQWFGRPQMLQRETLRHLARRDEAYARWAHRTANLLQPLDARRRVNGLHTYLRTRWLARRARCVPADAPAADAFYTKLYNPGSAGVDLNVEFHHANLVFQERVAAEPGWNETIIQLDRFRISPADPGRILIIPASDGEVRLVFTWLDFVTLAHSAQPGARPADKVKCVVWDLDNTLWTGVIGDDGPDGVVPRDLVADCVRRLDERGIVQSIASKNDYDVAWSKLRALGLDEYFLYPAIHWGPKSQSIRRIAAELNIHVDTFAFIDDSAFERAEVGESLPQVRVIDAEDIESLLARPEFDTPVTEASRMRRQSYLAESRRKRIAADHSGDHRSFLRSCRMTMEIRHPTQADQPRCLELIQRTNQLNLSTRRYRAADLQALIAQAAVECYALRCSDRFGDYGLVGFVSIDSSSGVPTLVDFVLSCRVAQKGVEEAFVYWYADKAKRAGRELMRAVFVPTERNQPLRDSFAALPFAIVEDHDDRQVLEFAFPDDLNQSDIVRVESGP